MNQNLFFAALRARFSIFALALIATVATGTAVSLLLPKSYVATASLVVDTRNEQSLSDALNVLMSSRERLGYIQTQVDIITSPRVARRVVADLGLAENPLTKARFEEDGQGHGAIEDWIAEQLLRQLEVATSQSSVIDVSFHASDPDYAATVANAFAKAYMDTMLELRVEPTRQAASWFDEQIKTLRADLEQSQAELTAYQKRHGIVSANGQADIEHTRLSELSTQLLEAQEQTIELRAREEQALLALDHPVSLEYRPEVKSDTRVQELRSELIEGEARLRQLGMQLGVNHPDYRGQLAENRSRRQELEAEMRTIVDVTASLRRESELRETQLRAALDAQRKRLIDLNETRDELGVLIGNVETAQKAYDTAMQRYVVSQVESRARQTNVALLSPAVAPAVPHRPKIPLNIALSVVVGAMLGIGLVVLMEMSDRRVRSVSDLDLGTPLIGVIEEWKPQEPPMLPTSPDHSVAKTG